MKTYHPHHQIYPVWHQVPAHRSARFDLFKDVRLGLGEGAEPEPGSPQRGRHGTTIPVGCQGRDSDTDAVFVTRTRESKRCTLTVPELWTRKSICDGVPATSAAAPTPARTTTGFANEGSVLTKLVPRTSHPLSAPVAGVWIAATRLPGTVTGASDAGAVNRVDFSTSSLPPHCLSEPARV